MSSFYSGTQAYTYISEVSGGSGPHSETNDTSGSQIGYASSTSLYSGSGTAIYSTSSLRTIAISTTSFSVYTVSTRQTTATVTANPANARTIWTVDSSSTYLGDYDEDSGSPTLTDLFSETFQTTNSAGAITSSSALFIPLSSRQTSGTNTTTIAAALTRGTTYIVSTSTYSSFGYDAKTIYIAEPDEALWVVNSSLSTGFSLLTQIAGSCTSFVFSPSQRQKESTGLDRYSVLDMPSGTTLAATTSTVTGVINTLTTLAYGSSSTRASTSWNRYVIPNSSTTQISYDTPSFTTTTQDTSSLGTYPGAYSSADGAGLVHWSTRTYGKVFYSSSTTTTAFFGFSSGGLSVPVFLPDETTGKTILSQIEQDKRYFVSTTTTYFSNWYYLHNSTGSFTYEGERFKSNCARASESASYDRPGSFHLRILKNGAVPPSDDFATKNGNFGVSANVPEFQFTGGFANISEDGLEAMLRISSSFEIPPTAETYDSSQVTSVTGSISSVTALLSRAWQTTATQSGAPGTIQTITSQTYSGSMYPVGGQVPDKVTQGGNARKGGHDYRQTRTIFLPPAIGRRLVFNAGSSSSETYSRSNYASLVNSDTAALSVETPMPVYILSPDGSAPMVIALPKNRQPEAGSYGTNNY